MQYKHGLQAQSNLTYGNNHPFQLNETAQDQLRQQFAQQMSVYNDQPNAVNYHNPQDQQQIIPQQQQMVAQQQMMPQQLMTPQQQIVSQPQMIPQQQTLPGQQMMHQQQMLPPQNSQGQQLLPQAQHPQLQNLDPNVPIQPQNPNPTPSNSKLLLHPSAKIPSENLPEELQKVSLFS